MKYIPFSNIIAKVPSATWAQQCIEDNTRRVGVLHSYKFYTSLIWSVASTDFATSSSETPMCVE